MSGENIYSLYAKSVDAEKQPDKNPSPYTGKYEKHMGEPTKPVYSTFYEKGKGYDGSNVRFFKQREAVIGKNVGDSVDQKNYLKKGGGVRQVVPPVHEEKVYCKQPLTQNFRDDENGNDAGGNQKSRGVRGPDMNGVPRFQDDGAPASGSYGARPAGDDGKRRELNDEDQNAEGVGCDRNVTPVCGDQQSSYVNTNGGYGNSRDATKDFVASNIVEVSNMVPKRRKEQIPLATSRKSFGQAPAYLSRVKDEVAQEKAFVQSIEDAKQQCQEQLYSKFVYLLPREEHEKLMRDLETRRDDSVSELRKMPFSKDTPSMQKRRTELERTIADIETALKKLDKDALFIYKDDPVSGQWAKEAALKEAQKYAAEAHRVLDVE